MTLRRTGRGSEARKMLEHMRAGACLEKFPATGRKFRPIWGTCWPSLIHFGPMLARFRQNWCASSAPAWRPAPVAMSAALKRPITVEIIVLPEDWRQVARDTVPETLTREPGQLRSCSNVAQRLSTSCPGSRYLAQIRPTLIMNWPTLAKSLVEFGRNRSKSADVGLTLPNFGQHWPTFCRSVPNFAQFGPIWAISRLEWGMHSTLVRPRSILSGILQGVSGAPKHVCLARAFSWECAPLGARWLTS